MAKQSATTDSSLPTPAGIDIYAQTYQELQRDAAAAKDKLNSFKGTLVKLAQKHGTIPEGAEKSMRLTGEKYTITASFGTSSSVDETVVEQIGEQLSDDCQSRLFARLFHKEVSHIVAPTAPTVLENCSKKVRELFMRVMTTKPKEASLKVEKKKAAKAAKAGAR